MSDILNQGDNKLKCQKFTPMEVVSDMLNLADYNHYLFGKKVLEFSFGTGNILASIVERYIRDAIASGLSREKVAEGLSTDIYGIELDKELYRKCIGRLNQVVASYGLPSIMWSLENTDAVHWNSQVQFDYVIGNPPYISYHDIDSDNREFIRENFDTCKFGKFDYCYAFIEKGLKALAPAGKMCLLVPSNIYKNVYANRLRETLKPGLVELWEYPDNPLFDGTLTSSSIFLFCKGNNNGVLQYKNATKDTTINICKAELGCKWVFETKSASVGKKRFGELFNASIAVATQYNKAFVIKDDFEQYETVSLKQAAAPRTLRAGKKEMIIFPYYYDNNGTLCKYTEEEFKQRFPLSYAHLKEFKEDLINRDADKNAKWYEYGRSQALAHLQQEKLLLSTVVSTSVELYRLTADCIPYSGIFVTVKKRGKTLDDAVKILRSDEFFHYVMSIGISINGKSKRITCKDINDYLFEEV